MEKEEELKLENNLDDEFDKDELEEDELEEDELEEDELDIEEFKESDDNTPVNEVLTDYIRHIANIPLLTVEEERELLKKATAGDKEAKKQLVSSNLRLVVSAAKKYQGFGVDLMDLIQEGNMGLMTAVDRFDITKENKFATYALCWIKQSIQRYVMNNGKSIRIPVHILESFNKIKKAKAKLLQQLYREPTIDELIEETGMSKDKISSVMRASKDIISLDIPISNEEGDSDITLIDLLASDDIDTNIEANSEYTELQKEIRNQLNRLTSKEREVIILRFGLDGSDMRTLEQVGEIYGVTRERIRQIESKAIRKLRLPASKKALIDFLY